MLLPLKSVPKSICLLRLSAIGDVTHVLPIVHSLRSAWPETKITWIIGHLEYQLVEGIVGIEFIVFDKSLGWRAYSDLRQQLSGRHFDVLLHMQVSLRASIASLWIKAPIKLGYDKARAKDFQWLFTTHRIDASPRQHVLDGFFAFIAALGVPERKLTWDIPLPEKDIHWAQQLIGSQATLVINPSSSIRLRNWRAFNANTYAQLIEYAIEQYKLQIALSGGPANNEYQLAEAILASEVFIKKPSLMAKVINLVGKTSLKQLAALLQQATVMVAPDTGPAHIANAVGTPVIGLYVTSNPLRTGPYCSQDLTINQYPRALKKFEGLDEADAPWGKRVRHQEALDLVTLEQIKEKLDQVMIYGHCPEFV